MIQAERRKKTEPEERAGVLEREREREREKWRMAPKPRNRLPVLLMISIN